MKIRIEVVFLVCAIYGCSKTEASPASSEVSKAKAPSTETAVIKRGDALPAGDIITLDQVATKPDAFSGKEVLVSGQASAVCQVKGCWMVLSGGKSTSLARVTFKDYAFFVPKDVKGMKAKMVGEVKVKFLSDAERAHLAEDGKVDVSSIPKAELRIVARGIELTP